MSGSEAVPVRDTAPPPLTVPGLAWAVAVGGLLTGWRCGRRPRPGVGPGAVSDPVSGPHLHVVCRAGGETRQRV